MCDSEMTNDTQAMKILVLPSYSSGQLDTDDDDNDDPDVLWVWARWGIGHGCGWIII